MILVRARYNKIKRLQFVKGWAWDVSNEESVELTDDEKDAALQSEIKSRETRDFFNQMRQANRDREQLKREAVEAEWNAERFYKLMCERSRERGAKLIVNPQTKPLISAICFLLAGDERYETDLGFSFSKGLMIRGSVGLGKSYAMQLVADNPLKPVQFVTMHEITRSVMDTGLYSGLKFASHGFVYLDDVGAELSNGGKVKHYGTEINWFASWFEEFYAKSKSHVNKIVFSTNDSFDSLEAKYGFRVRDRLAETFDVLDLYGTSMRRT